VTWYLPPLSFGSGVVRARRGWISLMDDVKAR